MAKTVSDLLVERLISWGVDTLFGIPGDGINGVFEALRTRQDKIKFIQVRHEEAAAFAACAYAKFAGRLGVCIATSGPGGIHLLNGLYDAKCDGAPVLAITGDTYHDLSGTHYQQDVDLVKAFMDVAEFNQRIMGPAHVENVVDTAVKTALMRRGVSHITIPKDIQEWTSQRSRANVPEHGADLFAAVHPMPHAKLIEAAAELINRGSKVAILVGQGCLGAREEILQLAEKAGAPIIKALLGKAVVPDDNPYTTGGIGLLGTAPSQDALQDCDTLIIAGSSMPYVEILSQAGQSGSRSNRYKPVPYRIASSHRHRSCWRVRRRASCALASGRKQNRSQFPRKSSEKYAQLERAHGQARHANRHTHQAASGRVGIK
jgi:pyruvate dehydrogenase (quinone)